MVHARANWQCAATGGQGHTAALVALVATKVVATKATGAGGIQWDRVGSLMRCYLRWVPPVVCTRPKWQCVAHYWGAGYLNSENTTIISEKLVANECLNTLWVIAVGTPTYPYY